MTTSSVKNRRRQDIDRPRGQFDDALGELTHKIDVPARIRDTVHAKESVRVKTEDVRQQTQAKAEQARQQAQAKAEQARQQAQAKAEQARQQAQAKAEEAEQQAQAKAEEAEQQAQAKAEQAKQQAQAKAEQAKQQAQAKAEQAKHQVHDGAEALPAEVSGMARHADRLTDQVLEELPSPVAERIEPLMTPARQWPMLTAAIAVGVLLVMLFLRRLLYRNR